MWIATYKECELLLTIYSKKMWIATCNIWLSEIGYYLEKSGLLLTLNTKNRVYIVYTLIS